MSKIIGVTVGTPISPERLHDKLNFVKTINNMAPDENGNVEIEVSGGNDDQGGWASSVIDLKKYGIVQADFVEPFTVENYNVAYQNGVGIQNAINDAKVAGLTEIILPAGNYPVCYHASADDEYNYIIDARGINFLGYGAKLYVLYDEVGTNPYFTGTTPRLLQGTIIATDHDVRGFHLIGERRFRKNENTKYREFSKGIGLMPYTRGNVIADCITELFSGDGIGCHQYMEQISGWPDDKFTSVDWDGTAFVESKTMFTSSVHDGTWIDQTKPMLIRCGSYFLYTTAPLRVLCFDENDALLGTVQFWQGGYFYLLPGTAKWYLQVVREVEHDPSTCEIWSYWLGNAYYCDTLIENCKVRFNQRGGISNLPTNSTVRNCEIHHNGCAYDGMVAFYDGTQFGIDIEDVYIHNITIEGCNIHGNIHGVLYRCWGITFKDCIIYGYCNSLNFCADFLALNTRFLQGCTMTTPMPYGSKTAIGCKFVGSIAPEINIVGKAVAKAELDVSDGDTVLFKDSAGETLFTLDLSMLGVVLGENIIPANLLADLDLTKLNSENLTIADNTGNLSVTATASQIVDFGVFPTGWGSGPLCTWKNTPDYTNGLSIELLSFGTPRDILFGGGTNTGSPKIDSWVPAGDAFVINQHKNTPTPSYGISFGANYINQSGETVNCSCGLTDRQVVLDDGTVSVHANDIVIPDLNSAKCHHFVFTYANDGVLQAFFNGYPFAVNKIATDFDHWDFSGLMNTFRVWSGQWNATRVLKSFRVYGKALSKQEVRNNFQYELKKLGTLFTVTNTLTNTTNSNSKNAYVKGNAPYIATLSAKDGYTMSSVVVVMDGADITATVYNSETGEVNIPAVTGNVTITANAV